MQRPRICERFESAAFKAVRPDPQELKYLSVPLRIRQLGRRISRPLVSTSTGKFGSSELTLSYRPGKRKFRHAGHSATASSADDRFGFQKFRKLRRIFTLLFGEYF